MIINGPALLSFAPIKDMFTSKRRHNGASHGLSEVGYDIRIKQDVTFIPLQGVACMGTILIDGDIDNQQQGNFTLASAMEEFHMPNNLAGIVHDKSTWARRGLSVFNTVIEPGWRGFLTLELVYHGRKDLHIPAGAGIAQVIFHKPFCAAEYKGKYQDQGNRPIPAIDG